MSIRVEVIYATPEEQRSVSLSVKPGTTARQVAQQARLERYFAALDSATQPIGVWGRVVSDSYEVREGDRVEIYRELSASPRELRRLRQAATDPSRGPRV